MSPAKTSKDASTELPVATDVDNGEYIRERFNVPAYLGGRVTIDGRHGNITGFDGNHLEVLLDGHLEGALAHPTWRITYDT